jgi:hypothetical protein
MIKYGYFKVFGSKETKSPGYIIVCLDRPKRGDTQLHEATFSFQKPNSKFLKAHHREICKTRKELNSTIVRFEHDGDLISSFQKALDILYTQGAKNKRGKIFQVPSWTLEPIKNKQFEFGLRQKPKAQVFLTSEDTPLKMTVNA